MSDTTGDAQNRYISLFEAARLLRVSLERITWFIATSQISSIKNPRNKSDRLVSLRDVYGLRNSPHLLGTELRKKSCSRKVDKCGTVFVTGDKSRRFWRVTKGCFFILIHRIDEHEACHLLWVRRGIQAHGQPLRRSAPPGQMDPGRQPWRGACAIP